MSWYWIAAGASGLVLLVLAARLVLGPRESVDRWVRKLQNAKTAKLAFVAGDIVTVTGLSVLDEGKALQASRAWTDQELLAALDALLEAAKEHDRRTGKTGRGSLYFQFCDGGLETLREILAVRTGVTYVPARR